MNFSEYRTLAERARRDDRLSEDEFEDTSLETPGWVQKYLDLADRAIRRSREEEERRERWAGVLRDWPYGT